MLKNRGEFLHVLIESSLEKESRLDAMQVIHMSSMVCVLSAE